MPDQPSDGRNQLAAYSALFCILCEKGGASGDLMDCADAGMVQRGEPNFTVIHGEGITGEHREGL